MLNRALGLLEERARSSKPVGMALVGAGAFGTMLLSQVRRLRGLEVVAVADPDEGGRAKAASASGAPRQYTDYRQMLEKERPEIVFVAWTRETGVVPAAIAGILVARGVPGQPELLTLVALAIIVTLLLQSTTKAWLARRLGLDEAEPQAPRPRPPFGRPADAV